MMRQAKVFADTRKMTRDEWLESRRKGIGGSDASAILGLNPYSSPLAVYLDKIGKSEDWFTETSVYASKEKGEARIQKLLEFWDRVLD